MLSVKRSRPVDPNVFRLLVSRNVENRGIMTCDRVTVWPSDQVTKWPSDWMTKWLNDQVTEWLNDWMTEWSNDRMTGWQDDRKLRSRLTVWYIYNIYLFCCNHSKDWFSEHPAQWHYASHPIQYSCSSQDSQYNPRIYIFLAPVRAPRNALMSKCHIHPPC